MKTLGKNLRLLLFLQVLLTMVPSAHAANYYWVNGKGNWSDNFNHWALSSGGNTFHAEPPGHHDNVFFDANSFTQPGDTVFSDVLTAACKTMNWTGVLNNPVFYYSYHNTFYQGQTYNPFGYDLRIYGSLILDHNMVWGFTGSVGFVSNLAGNTILSAGVPINSDITFDNPNGGWFLADSLATGAVYLQYGNLNTNNQYVNCYKFEGGFYPGSYLYLGTSEIRCSYSWGYLGGPDQINASNATISFDNALVGTYGGYFSSSDSVQYYHVIFYDNGSLGGFADFHIEKVIFKKNAYFTMTYPVADTLIIDNPGYEVKCNPQTNQILGGNYTIVNGSCYGTVSFESGYLIQDSGSVIFNYCTFGNFSCSGNASFSAYNSFPSLFTQAINFYPPAVSDLYWVGNTGNWHDPAHWSTSSGGAGGGNCLPTPFTNVHIDSSSFSSPGQTINIDSSQKGFCRTFEWSNTQPNSTFNSGDSLSQIFIFRDFNLAVPMNFDFRGNVVLKSDTIGNTIHTGNNLLNCEVFSIDAIHSQNSFYLSDSLKVNGEIYLKTGTAYSSGKYVSSKTIRTENQGNFDVTNSTIDLIYGINGNMHGYDSRIFLHGNATSGAGIYMYGHLGMIECFSDFYGGSSIDAEKIILHGNATFGQDIDVDTLIFNNPDKTITFRNDQQLQPPSLITYFSANGTCSQPVSIIGNIGVGGWPELDIQFAVISYAYIEKIASTNSVTANNSIDGGLNGGITFTPVVPQNKYWIGGSGDWDDPSHWSYSSGGVPASCPPSPVDNVYFDANSFTAPGQSVYIKDSEYRGCASMDWTGAAFNPSLVFDSINYLNFKINGSLTLIPQMSWSNNAAISFGESNAPKTIAGGGHDLSKYSLTFAADSLYGYILTDSLFCSGGLAFTSGKFNSANQKINSNGLSSYSYQVNPSQVYLHNGFIQVKQLSVRNYSSIPGFLAADATIETEAADLMDSLSTIGTLTINGPYSGAGDFCRIKKLVLKNNATLTYDFIIDTLLVENPDYALTIQDSLKVNNYLDITGSSGCERFCTIQSYNSSKARLIVPSGSVLADYVALQSIKATGGAYFEADHCLDLGNNQGWTIIDTLAGTKNFYWINGGGNWSDPQHWSFSSGGGSSGCIPAKYDNVYFDANSFSGFGDTVWMDLPKISFNDMDWTGVQYDPTLTNWQYMGVFSVGGSIILAPNLHFQIDKDITFTANDSDNVINFSGVAIQSLNEHTIKFSEFGLWQLQDSLSVDGYTILLEKGTLKSNDHLIRCHRLETVSSSAKKINLDLGSSSFYGNFFCSDTSEVELNAINASFHSYNFTGGGNQEYGYLESTGSFNFSSHIQKVLCSGIQITLPGSSSIDTLIFSDNLYVCRFNSDSCFISAKWIINSNAAHPILFIPSSNDSSLIVKTNDTLCFDDLFLDHVSITGGVTPYAGYNSINLGNSNGWIYSSCAVQIDSVWPGDANYDLIANNVDILNIGIAYGETGPVRTNPVITWTPQFAADWNQNFTSGFNYKHADCNGDGIVDNLDTTAVSLNYGLVHPFKPEGLPPQLLTAPLLYLVSSVDSTGLSQALDVDVFLGLASLPVDSIYGIAFTINFNAALVDTTSLTFDYTGSWMGTAGNDMLTFEKQYASSGYVDLAMVRTDHANVSGYGFLGRMGVVIVDNVAGKMSLPFTLSNVTAITYDQTLLEFNLSGDSVDVDTTALQSIAKNPGSDIRIFPVPAREFLIVYSTGIEMDKIELCNLYGEVLYTSIPVSKKQTINTMGMKSGIYVLRCHTPGGVINRKVELLNH